MVLAHTFVHHVYFWLKNKSDKPLLIEGLNMLVPISHIREIHIGAPAETYREVVDRSYDISLLLLFDNKEAHDAYQVDPVHEHFAKNYAKTLCEKVVVLDSVNV